jgi:hypothetical protein
MGICDLHFHILNPRSVAPKRPSRLHDFRSGGSATWAFFKQNKFVGQNALSVRAWSLMDSLKTIKEILDGGKRAQFLFQVVGFVLSASATAGLRALIYNTRIPSIWRLPIYLLCAAFSLLLFASIGRWCSVRKTASFDEARQTINDVKKSAGQAILMGFMSARATSLAKQLEIFWHQWDNNGEKLIHPLDVTLDKLKDYSSDEARNLLNARRDFLVMYSEHISVVRVEFPEFRSNLMAAGYPAPNEYVQVRADLAEHADQLEQMAGDLWNKY